MPPPYNTTSVGSYGEHLASVYLQQQGLSLITRNYRCAQGEIDLIFCQAHELIFVEVKTRRQLCPLRDQNLVPHSKQQKIIHTAHHYILHHPQYDDFSYSFDIIRIGLAPQRIEWLPHAFSPFT